MVFRVLEYVLQIYKRELRDWQQEHGALDGFRFQPVLPVVLYSGTRTWDRLARIAELLEPDANLPEGLTPEFLPLFLNVGQISGTALESRGGAFGWMLRLVQQRRLKRAVFEKALHLVVRTLEERVADADRERWLELLSYVYSLIYHEREPSEREALHELVVASVENDRHRQEVFDMGKTIAEDLMERGEARGVLRARREMLLVQLQERYKRVPANVVKRIENTDDLEQLKAWIKAFAKADALADVGIPPLE